MRESPALEVIELLKEEGYRISVYDPHVKRREYESLDEAIEDADLILILTDHKEYKDMSYREIGKKMRHAVIFDTKNMIKVQEDAEMKVINYGNLYQYKK